MTAEAPSDGHVLVGLVRVRDHCTFTWRGREGSDVRTVTVHDHHCPPCLTAILQRGFRRADEPEGER